jgi:hypothetical protein
VSAQREQLFIFYERSALRVLCGRDVRAPGWSRALDRSVALALKIVCGYPQRSNPSSVASLLHRIPSSRYLHDARQSSNQELLLPLPKEWLDK